MTSILVVDDERSVREGLARVFSAAGWHVLLAADLAGARDALADEVACVVLDVRLPDGDGIAFLDELRSAQPRLPVILATAYGDSDRTITAMRLGAFEYVTKPFDLDALLAVVRRAVETPAAAAAPSEPPSDATLIGSSARMLEIWKAIGRASAADVPALITGESGVGKELVARAIHQNSARRGAPFVAVNLAALPPTLIESELFGHEKGAFTGAVGRREGRFEAASEGTLFLDEIGDLDVPLQTKLLRVLQDGTFERVGSQEPLKSNARVLAATSKPVEPGAPNAALREDLFYRISVVRLQIPPLRERRSDIPLLVEHYLRRLPGLRRAVSEAAMELLSGHGWPGNVRELHHVLERAAVMSTAEVLDVQDFQLPARPPGGAVEESGELHLKRATAALETRLIRAALLRANGNRAEAARLLGIARPQLYVKMKELGIDPQ